MLRSIFQLSFLLFLGLSVLLTSCNKDDIPELTDADFYIDNAIYGMQRDGACGRLGCFEFVFPVSISFEDGSTASVDSYDEMGTAIRAYFETNPDADTRPELVYPLEILTSDGELQTIDSAESLRAVGAECADSRFDRNGPRGHRARGLFCFKLVFPITVEFEDGSTQTVQDRLELKTAIRTWFTANPDSEERPHLTFPLTVEDEDGVQTTVNSREELRALKEACRS